MAEQRDKYLLLDSLIGWRVGKLQDLVDSKEKSGITLQPKPQPLNDPIGSFAGLDMPCGFAVDYYGGIYFSDPKGNCIMAWDICRREEPPIVLLEKEGENPRQSKSPRGIAISQSQNLYVADSDNHRIQIFALKGLALRDIWGKVDNTNTPVSGSAAGEFNTPWDIAVDAQENIYVVDKGNNRIQKFNHSGQFLLEFGQGKLTNPQYISIDNKSQILVTDDTSKIQVFSDNGDHISEVEVKSDVQENFSQPPIWVDSAGRIHYSIAIPFGYFFSGKLDNKSNKRTCAEIKTGLLPGVVFQNDKLAFSSENLPNPMVAVPKYGTEGVYWTQALDSKVYRCKWHKIVMEADIPLSCSIKVETYTAESAIDFLQIPNLSDHLWQTRQLNAEKCLIQSPEGRYLWFKIILKGNGTETPVLKRIKVYYPRDSYLKYLPAIYQDEPTSKLFLQQFLSIFEEFFSGFENKISLISHLFNPSTTSKDFLPWLAAWLGLSLEEKIAEETKRELIQKAHLLFAKRGTPAGLRMVLKIYFGYDFPILESFKLRRWAYLGKKSWLGGNSFLWGKRGSIGDNAILGKLKLRDSKEQTEDPIHSHNFRFILIIPHKYCNSEEKLRMLQRIVDLWKPAWSTYTLYKTKAKLRIGLQSLIGINTIIGKYPLAILGHKSRLAKDSVLAKPAPQMGRPEFILNEGQRLNKTSIIN